MMSTDTIAYIAGLFDGEGCVSCKKKKTKRKDRGGKIYNQWYIRCEIAMTDKHIIEWIHETLGFGWCADSRRSPVNALQSSASKCEYSRAGG